MTDEKSTYFIALLLIPKQPFFFIRIREFEVVVSFREDIKSRYRLYRDTADELVYSDLRILSVTS